MIYFGIDVGNRNHVVVVLNEHGQFYHPVFTIQNTRDGLGLRTQMTDLSGVTNWAYDSRGQVISETRIITGGLGMFTTAWGYNSAGLADWMQYPADDLGNLGERLD